MVVARRRRRRRPIVPLLAVLATAAVVAIALGGHSPDTPDKRLAWLDEVRPVVERSNQLGKEFADLRDQVRALDRATLGRRLARLAHQGQVMVSQVDAFARPPSLRDAHALLVATFVVRARALNEARAALDAAVGTDPVSQAAERLASVGADLTVADRDYELFLAAVPRLAHGTTVPSKWVVDPTLWDPAELHAFVASVRAGRVTGPVRDLAVVTVALDPPATGREGDAEIVPAARSLRLRVVVANIGNEPARRVPVVAAITAAAGQTDTARQFVTLVPGQRTVVSLGGLRPVVGEIVTLSVTVGPVEGETSIADNTWTRRLAFR